MSKPILLMLHGALGTKDFYLPLETMLSPHFELISFDFIGHGSADIQAENLSVELYAQQLSDFLQREKIEKPFVFGYSMGGYAAMFLEKMQPNTFAKIMTFATIYDWNPENAKRQVAQMNWEKIQQKIPHFAQYMEKLHGEKTGDLFQKLGDMFLQTGDNPPIMPEDFAKMQTEICLGVGDRDGNVSIEETLHTYRKLSKGRFFVLPNTPHPFEKVPAKLLIEQLLTFFLD